MTLEQIQAMTDDEIRVRVAEACGWKNVHRFNKWQEGGTASYKDGDLVGDFGDHTRWHLPNYPADLNACHSMEKTLRENQFHFVAYTRKLWRVVFPNVDYTGDLGYLGFDYIHATARARCEAFLAVMQPETP